jgi:MFS transporter, DHA3 family, macrolide efflux protein
VNSNLGLLWFGQTVSIAGDSVFETALIWLMLELTGSSGIAGLVVVAAHLPAIVVGLWAGVAVDRLDRRKVMISSDIVRALLVLSIPILFALGFLNPWTLFVITFFVASAATFFNPARDSMIPSLVPDRDHLLKANAVIQSSWMFALLLGPGLALVILGLFEMSTVDLFYLDSATFVVSMFALFAITTGSGTPVVVVERKTYTRDLLDGLLSAAKDVRVRWLLIITAVDNLFIMGPATIGMAVFVREELHRDLGSLMVIQASYAVGMVIGTMLLPLWRARFNEGRIILIGMILDGLTFVPLYWVDSLVATCAVIVVHSLAIPMLVVVRPALIQRIVPEGMQGRVFAMMGAMVVGFTALSTGLTGGVAEIVSMPVVYVVIGLGAALCGILGLTVRELRES